MSTKGLPAGASPQPDRGPENRDPLAALTPQLSLDLSDRRHAGIRISLPRRPPPPADRLPAATRLRDLEYVVVDVETTGGPVSRGHRITEVAAVRMRGDGSQVEEFTSLINPERPIPPFISTLTRITPEMVCGAPRFAEVAGDVMRVLSGAVFVAHNVAFDWRFVRHELGLAAVSPPRNRTLCTVRLARRVVPEVSSRSLDALQFYFGVENPARHRAFGDARATAAVFRRLLERLDEREIDSWDELEHLLARRAPRRKRRASPTSMKEA